MAAENIVRHHRMLGEQVVKALRLRHFEAEYCETKEEALEKALALLPEGCSIGWGGCASVDEIGLKEAIRGGKYTLIDRDAAQSPAERTALMKKCLSADVFLTGTNALSEDGQLVNIDGNGNRVAAYCYGPDTVLVICGINKVAPSLEAAVSRARHWAAPVNAARFPGETPCRRLGKCGDCISPNCICNQLLITRTCRPAGRIKVLLVGEELGH